MQIVCPHCHNAMEQTDVTPPGELVCPACGSHFRVDVDATAAWSPSEAERKLGKFELIDVVGSGGFGTVYRALDPELQRTVAIKVPRAGHLAGSADLDRFVREARSVAQLRHPSIVSVYEVGQADHVPYLVSEFVEGISLADVLSAKRLPFRDAAELVAAVADALEYAHRMGVIHRDVKPGNIMLETRGVATGQEPSASDHSPVTTHYSPRLMDFGLAKREAGDVTMTMDGQVLGTPAYMSPEQARGEAHKVDGRTDVYSLGVVLYLMLTGELPFRGTSRMLLHQVLHDEPRRPRSLNDHVPHDLQTICMKAMAKEPARRFATASQFADDLRRFLRGEPIQARPVTGWERAWRWARRRPAVAALTAGLIVALTGLLGLGAWSYASIRQALAATDAERQNAVAARHEEAQQRAEAEKHRDAAVAETYRALVSETQALRLAHVPGWRDRALQNLRRLAALETPQRDFAELRTEAIACASELDVRELGRFEGHTAVIYGLDFSPDGKTLASADYSGKICLWDLARQTLERRWNVPSVGINPHWSAKAPLPNVRFRPDGSYLAYTTGNQRVTLLGRKNLEVPFRQLEGKSQPRFVVFDPQGKRLAVSWGNGEVGIYDAATGAIQQTIAAGTRRFYMPLAFSPKGDLLAVRGPREEVRVYFLDDKREPVVLGRHEKQIRGFAFSPDGKLLASASEDHTAKIWDVTTRKEPVSLRGHTSLVISIAFHPGGRLVATGSDDSTLRFWDAQSGRALITVSNTSGPAQAIAFSPDGSQLAAAGDTLVLYQMATGFPEQQVPGHGMRVLNVAFHPGKPVVASTSSYLVRLWDVAANRELRSFSLPGTYVARVQFSPDGRLLAVSADPRFGIVRLGTAAADGPLTLLEIETGRLRKRFTGPYGGEIAFDPSSKRLAAGGSDGTVTVWDTASEEKLQHWQCVKGTVVSVAFIDNGARLLVADLGGLIVLVDAASGKQLGQAVVDGGISSMIVTPDAERCVVAGFDAILRALTLPDLRLGATSIRAHASGPVSLSIRGDGKWLASGGLGARVMIWDPRTLQLHFAVPFEVRGVLGLAFQPGSDRLALAGVDEIIRIRDLAFVEAVLDQEGFSLDRRPPMPPGRAVPAMRRYGWPPEVAVVLPPLAEHILAVKPDQAELSMQLAWVYLTGPDKIRNAQKALPLAQRAMELAPDEPMCWNTLGAAYYRLDRWNDALEALQRACQLQSEGGTVYDWLFLTMTYHHLGQAEKAREQQARAVAWLKDQPDLDPLQAGELKALRAEADALLSMKVP